jgi:hypothetical protein
VGASSDAQKGLERFPLANCKLIVGKDKFRMEDVVGFRMENILVSNIDDSRLIEVANQKFIEFYNGLNGKT